MAFMTILLMITSAVITPIYDEAAKKKGLGTSEAGLVISMQYRKHLYT